jgi:hypothetical protein
MAPPRDVTRVANTVECQPALQMGARVGYAVSGVLHLLIGWIALQVAWSASPKSADQSGALQSLAGSSLGRLTLWVAVLGFLALGLWQLSSALAVRTGGESSKWAVKAKGIAKAVVYLALAWTSFSFTKGQPTSSKTQSADLTATLLQHSGGRIVVAVIGVVVIGVGGYHVMKGWTKKFLQDLAESPASLRPARGWSAMSPRVSRWPWWGSCSSVRRCRTQRARRRDSTGRCAPCVSRPSGHGS